MNNQINKIGIKQQIKASNSRAEIKALLEKLSTFKYASNSTKRACYKAAANRLAHYNLGE